jgi:hypothetical protein
MLLSPCLHISILYAFHTYYMHRIQVFFYQQKQSKHTPTSNSSAQSAAHTSSGMQASSLYPVFDLSTPLHDCLLLLRLSLSITCLSSSTPLTSPRSPPVAAVEPLHHVLILPCAADHVVHSLLVPICRPPSPPWASSPRTPSPPPVAFSALHEANHAPASLARRRSRVWLDAGLTNAASPEPAVVTQFTTASPPTDLVVIPCGRLGNFWNSILSKLRVTSIYTGPWATHTNTLSPTLATVLRTNKPPMRSD